MAFNCIIVDDEPLAQKVLEEYLSDIEQINVKGKYVSPIDALNHLKSSPVDILFLDINMPRLDGFQFIDQIENIPIVIFTTAYPEYAVKAFEVKAFDYLVKPISFDRFLKSCNRAIDHLKEGEDGADKDGGSVLIKENKRLYKLSQKEIYYVKAFGDYVRIFTTHKTYIVKDRLQRFSSELNDRFFKVHRSYIVNLDWIHYLEGNHLVINEEKIPVSETYRNELISKI